MITIRVVAQPEVGRILQADEPTWPWSMQCAADIFNRCKRGHGGAPAYKRIRRRDPMQPLFACGGKASHLCPAKLVQTMDKAESRWRSGVSVGYAFAAAGIEH